MQRVCQPYVQSPFSSLAPVVLLRLRLVVPGLILRRRRRILARDRHALVQLLALDGGKVAVLTLLEPVLDDDRRGAGDADARARRQTGGPAAKGQLVAARVLDVLGAGAALLELRPGDVGAEGGLGRALEAAEARRVGRGLHAQLREVQVRARLVARVHHLRQLALRPDPPEGDGVDRDRDRLDHDLDQGADQAPIL